MSGDYCCLVSYLWLKFFGLINHLLYLACGRNAAADVELSVDLLKLRLQILSHTMTELLNGVDASLFKQFGKLWADAIDTEEVGMVRPTQDQLLTDACSVSQLLAALGGCALLEQFTYFVDTSGNEFLCINVAYTFDVDNFVIHNDKSLKLMVNIILGANIQKNSLD